MLIPLVVLALAASSPTPLGIRVEMAALGRGGQGTVVGVAVQVAPEDRSRAGHRVRVTVTLLHGDTVVDRGGGVVELEQDGSAMLYREWPTGEGRVQVAVESADGKVSGAWEGTFVVPELSERFEPPADAPADALALAVRQPSTEGVKFRAPAQTGGIGAMELRVDVPSETVRVVFSQDGKELFTRNRPPWTVSVALGEVARRTTIEAIAYDAGGDVLGEDAFVLNGAPNQLPVEILVRAGARGASAKDTVTVSVSGSKPPVDVRLTLGDALVAEWPSCPCVVALPHDRVTAGRALTADAVAADGTRGDAVYLVGQGGFIDQVRVDKVELPVVVLDAAGNPVAGLPRDAFKAFEDGREVRIDGFGTTADLPLSLGLAVDTSGSMAERWKEVKAAVADFGKQLLRGGDQAYLLTFSFDATMQVPWTDQEQALVSALNELHPDGGTSLYDAIVHSLEAFRGRKGRKALVLLTDGDDTTSRTGWDVALRFARTARVPIFPIGLRIGTLDFFIRGRLRDLAQATGGEAFFAAKTDKLPGVYDEISRQLRSQYLLAYASPSSEGVDHFRTVRVDVSRPGLRARTIAGYFPSQ
jgi:VWFA-related protein